VTNAQLWHGAELLPLRPKPFAVLQYLADNAGRVIPRAELAKAVWPQSHVSSAVLRGYIRDLRAVLRDPAGAPRYIETVGRRGYRFIAPTTSSSRVPAGAPSAIVGREAELRDLRHSLRRAAAGERQMVFVTGEAGIGKTTLVDAFVAEAEANPGSSQSTLWIGRGQCIEHYGTGEAYLPVLEALGRLGEEPDHERLTEVLRRYAPTWLTQLPALLLPAERERLQREVEATARDRMLRELSDACEALTGAAATTGPSGDRAAGRSPLLVLVLEDLQWSDHATLDWLSALARRRAPARLMVIGTGRLTDAIVNGHPLKGLIHDLQLHRRCAELVLGPLSEEAVAEYVAVRLPGEAHARSAERLAGLLHDRTDGNPLFMVNVVEDLVAQGLIKEGIGHWELCAAQTEVERQVPESLRQMIERQLERLGTDDLPIVEAGSVSGREFAVSLVAGSLAADATGIEERCAALARQGQLLRACGSRELPDGTVTPRYEFVHALHQRVVYDRLTPGRCRQLHQRIGEQEERVYGSSVHEIAAELAVHFERARDVPRAVRYHEQAAETAFRRHAYEEARTHLDAGLTLLRTLPESPERAPRELTLLALLGPILIASKSWGSAAVEATYARARVLCAQIGNPPQVFPVLWGAFAVHTGRAELRTAHGLAEEILALAERERDRGLLMKAHEALGLVALIRGELPSARRHYEKALGLYDLEPHALVSLSGPADSGVSCLSRSAMVLALMGFAEQAEQRTREGLTLAETLGNRISLVSAVLQASVTAWTLGDVAAARAYAERDLMIAQEWSLPAFVPLGLALRGWALAADGQAEAGIAQIQEGLSHWQAEVAEMVIYEPPLRCLLAAACVQDGRVAEGLRAVNEGLAAVERDGTRLQEAELWRLKGELLLKGAADGPSPVGSHPFRGRRRLSRAAPPNPRAEAESCFHQAIAVARRQRAKLLELRATMSLAREWQRQGREGEARRRLGGIHGGLPERAGAADLREAEVLLESLR
jgi:DNA-binding winged helix-turn-helix (wHTH) protein/predicted ATPase